MTIFLIPKNNNTFSADHKNLSHDKTPIENQSREACMYRPESNPPTNPSHKCGITKTWDTFVVWHIIKS